MSQPGTPAETPVVEKPAETPAVVETPVEKTPEWVQPRINAITKERYDAERKAELAEARAKAAEAALEALKKPGETIADPTKTTPEKKFSLEEVEKLAEERQRIKETQTRLNTMYNEGVNKFTKEGFDKSLQNLQNVGWGNNPQSFQLAEAAAATGKAAEVLHHLSSDLATAQRLLSLPPVQMGVELAKIADKIEDDEAGEDGKDRKVLPSAPAPIRPKVKGTGASTPATLFDTDKLSTKEWIAMRNKEARTLPNGKRKAGM